ncbi:MAG TPA: NAD(P)-dependent oxidoreductase [Candidatus Saccharimonadales bacterium]|nr:NAD(P)-dependent oxidoreductase [Candidatus Saccharimonadales bacterium]
MKKVLITGSNGVIGSVLRKGLEQSISPYDLPEFDARNYAQLATSAKDHDAIIHLAWETKTDNWRSGELNPENILMAFNVYKSAIACGVRRVIMASSVHADTYMDYKSETLVDPYALPTPDSPYGAGKCMVEALGRYYARYKDLEVICIRFGGVNSDDDSRSSLNSTDYTWLSHRDCSDLINACLEAHNVLNSFAIIYGVSNHPKRIHDYTNPFGWQPKDGAK